MNRKLRKKLILADRKTRFLYRIMQGMGVLLVISCCVVILAAKQVERNQKQVYQEAFGSWNEAFLHVADEELSYFYRHAFLEDIALQKIADKVFVDQTHRLVIGFCDEHFLDMGNIHLLKGKMPAKEKEVAVEEAYLPMLAVKQIGDVVPQDAEARGLAGYRLVGIVENYSALWKRAHAGMDFVNCFVSEAQSGQNTVYVRYGPWMQNDLEVNWIGYRKNLQFGDFDLYSYLGDLFVVIGMTESVCYIKIQNRIARKTSYYYNECKRKWAYAVFLCLLACMLWRGKYVSVLVLLLLWYLLKGTVNGKFYKKGIYATRMLALCTFLLVLSDWEIINRIKHSPGLEKQDFICEGVIDEQKEENIWSISCDQQNNRLIYDVNEGKCSIAEKRASTTLVWLILLNRTLSLVSHVSWCLYFMILVEALIYHYDQVLIDRHKQYLCMLRYYGKKMPMRVHHWKQEILFFPPALAGAIVCMQIVRPQTFQIVQMVGAGILFDLSFILLEYWHFHRAWQLNADGSELFGLKKGCKK